MKKFLSLVVAALLTVSAVATSASAAKFTDVDVKNEALNDAVELLVALGVTKGTTDTTFGTAENVTRQQMAAFIYRMMKAGKSVEGGVNTTAFTDLDDSTFFFMVSWANSQGIIKGTSATTFNPKGGITLQDAYTMIVRALGYDDGTLAYPISYISLAEDLGLDEDLPSTLNYTDTLTRGDVAIILANMFYAETAEVEIKYEASWKEVQLSDGSYAVVSNGQVPKEYHKTVAEAIFEVEKISQRVVATPNYSFEGNEMPEEDVEMIVLSKDYVVDYDDYDTDINSLGQIEFAELGLEGKADDYFLNDIVMFVKEVDGEYEIFGATASGTKTTVAFDKVEFGTVAGSAAEKYYDGADKEYKIINGKLTLDGVVTYLFDAPYSFSKNADDYDLYNAQFITLDAYVDGRSDDEDVLDVNFSYVIEDVEADEAIVGTFVPAEEEDEEGAWIPDGYLSQLYFKGLGEIDVYDCDGNGKPDYLFVKNFVTGVIDDEEDNDIRDIDEVDVELNAEELVIYTDKTIVEGEAADKDIVLAYVNPDANYVKIVEVLEGKDATVASSASKYFTLSTGEKIYFKGLKTVVANGAANLDIDEETEFDFDAEATYYFTADGRLVYVTGLATAINLNENYVVVLEDEAFQTTSMVDGKLVKAYYIDIYNDGEIKSVQAKKIDEDTSVCDEDTPATVTEASDYDFSAYVNKLATGKSDKKGAYYFNLIDFEINNDIKALWDKEEDANEFRATGVTTVFDRKSGYLFNLDHAADVEDSKIKGVYIKDYTQIIIRSVDKDGEEIVTTYGYDNLPNFKEGTKLYNVSYILINNVNSTSYENLAVLYGTTAEEIRPNTGKVADVRVVRGYSKASTEDGTVYYYDVFDPFTGKVETAVEGAEVDEAAEVFAKGAIVGLTTEKFINNELAAAGNAYTAGAIYNVDGDYDFEELEGELGYVEVLEYDETTGYLEVDAGEDYEDAIFQITDKTVVTFSDKSDETIKVVDSDVLASTAKTYRQGEDKNNALRVFLCVEENEDADNEDFIYYNVKFAMIVRD